MLRLYFSIPLKWLVDSVVIGIIKLFKIALPVTQHKINAISFPSCGVQKCIIQDICKFPKFFPVVLGVTLYLDGYT